MVIRGKEAKRRMKAISFISQNVRGIKSVNRLEELFYVLSQRKNVVGVCLQETWRFDKEILEYESYRMITSGLTKMRLMEIEDPKELVLFYIRMVSLHGKLLAQSHMLI